MSLLVLFHSLYPPPVFPFWLVIKHHVVELHTAVLTFAFLAGREPSAAAVRSASATQTTSAVLVNALLVHFSLSA